MTDKGIIIHYSRCVEKAPVLESNLITVQQYDSFVIKSNNPMFGLEFEK